MNSTMTAEKVRAGQPYLYRKNGLPSEVYEIRMNDNVEHNALNEALAATMERYPYFKVRLLCILQKNDKQAQMQIQAHLSLLFIDQPFDMSPAHSTVSANSSPKI